MHFTSTQLNVVGEPSRFFFMKARRGGLPVDVYHAFENGEATMRVRILSMVPLARSSGPELTRAETVTLFNDMSVFAPAALLDAPVRWEAVDEHTVRGVYTVGRNTVSAELVFNGGGELVDFRSEDRLAASEDGRGMERRPWAPRWVSTATSERSGSRAAAKASGRCRTARSPTSSSRSRRWS